MRKFVSFLRPRASSIIFCKCRTETCLSSFRENKCCSIHSCSASTKTEEDEDQLRFRTLLFKRLQQAHRSVAIEVPSEKALFKASRFIEELSEVKEIVHFTSKSRKDFIIAEFQDVGAVQNFLSAAKSVVRNDEVPTFSRILRYSDTNCDKDNSKEISEVKSSKNNVGSHWRSDAEDKTFTSITEVVKHVHEEEKLTELESRLRFLVCSQVSDTFCGFLSHCEVLPFGSSVNGLGTHTSDLDAVLVFYAKKEHEGCGLFFQTKELHGDKYEEKILNTVGNVLNKFTAGVIDVEPLYRARVPLVKFYHEPFELDCDLSLNNVSGLEMSELLYNCGLLDSRVRPLAFAVKKWAKVTKVISNTGTHTITNFSLFLMLVFFLQTRPLPILPALSRIAEVKSNDENCRITLDSLKSATCNEETLDDLLKGFFGFLQRFDFRKNGISPYYGKTMKKFENSPLIIENPLERNLNTSLNVTKNSLKNLIQVAAVTENHLEVLSKTTELRNSYFWKTLSSKEHTKQ